MFLKLLIVLSLFSFIRESEGFESDDNLELKKIRINSRVSVDDAQALLKDLGELVLGNILAAHDQIENLRYELTSYRVNVRLNAEVDIEQEHLALEQQLVNLKGLALTAEANITSCLETTESRLEEVPDVYLDQVKKCISATQPGSDEILNDARYNVDIKISQVNSLHFSLGRCSESDSSCIEEVIENIKQVTEDLPVQIQIVVNSAQDDVDVVKVKIQNCYDDGVTGLVKEGNDIIQNITDCVNDIIS